MNPVPLANPKMTVSAGTPPCLIELREVTKLFRSRMAVDRLSLAVRRGEIHGLLGHNGAGKSTAIGMMLGQVWPSGGDVLVCGADVNGARATALARVGAIFEAPVFYDYLSGHRNLEILSAYTAPTSKARIAEVLAWVGLTGREDSKVGTYSHGMRARLALAQALLPNPELLILDEPSDGLDPEGIHEMRATILKLRRDFGLTILLSSHLLTEVEQLCDRITVLRKGRKVFEGNLNEARFKKGWLRLGVDDFARAVELIRAQGWLQEVGTPPLLSLQPAAAVADVVRMLVLAGLSVSEVTGHQETLEDFYLTLMREA